MATYKVTVYEVKETTYAFEADSEEEAWEFDTIQSHEELGEVVLTSDVISVELWE